MENPNLLGNEAPAKAICVFWARYPKPLSAVAVFVYLELLAEIDHMANCRSAYGRAAQTAANHLS